MEITGKQIECQVKIQGCREWQPGVAVGRMGKQLLVRYKTVTGREPRERWFPPHRYQLHLMVRDFVPTLTRYKRETIKAKRWESPVVAVARAVNSSHLPLDRERCPKCGGEIRFETLHNERLGPHGWGAVGTLSHSHIVKVDTGEIWS
jgi:hypothetical protein